MHEVAWLVFTPASLVLIVTPGQDMVRHVALHRPGGAAVGVVTAAGVSVGLIGQTLLATLGPGTVLSTSEWLFLALKLVGAAYLVYLGVGLLTRATALVVEASPRRSLRRLFLDGAFTNISNPKIAIFDFAFLPQFVKPAAEHPTRSVFVLGLVFAVLTFLLKGQVGYFAGLLSGWLRSRPGVLAWLHRSSGALLLALGVRLAMRGDAYGAARAPRGATRRRACAGGRRRIDCI